MLAGPWDRLAHVHFLAGPGSVHSPPPPVTLPSVCQDHSRSPPRPAFATVTPLIGARSILVKGWPLQSYF